MASIEYSFLGWPCPTFYCVHVHGDNVHLMLEFKIKRPHGAETVKMDDDPSNLRWVSISFPGPFPDGSIQMLQK
jgi:hypothetical protein